MSKRELYDLLGVSQDSSQADIKKAFRKKALEHHPDKGGDTELFKKINSAYEILSDPQKRKIYDERGEEGFQEMNLPEGFAFDLGNIFNLFRNVRNMIRKTPPTVYVCLVKLEDLCTNKTKKLRINRERLCSCVEKCKECEGSGQKVQMRQLGPFLQHTNVPCPTCKGKCTTAHCHECHEGLVSDSKDLEVQLSNKIKDGEKIVFQGEGNQVYNHEPGDFIVEIKYAKHPIFSVKDSDLCYTHTVSLLEALIGYTYVLSHPSGEMVDISSPYTTPETVKRIPGKGLEGDLVVIYKIVFPQMLPLSSQQQQNLKSLLQ